MDPLVVPMVEAGCAEITYECVQRAVLSTTEDVDSPIVRRIDVGEYFVATSEPTSQNELIRIHAKALRDFAQ